MSLKVKLHARPGLHSLHIADDIHEVAADGTVHIPAEHVDVALSHGCAHEPFEAVPRNAGDRFDEMEARIAELEAKWAAAEVPAGKGKK